MKKLLLAGIPAASALWLAGCVFIAGNTIEPEGYRGGIRAGGGLEITYIVPEDGVINLVDRRTGRNLMSKSVTAGETYEFSAKEMNPAEEKKWGVDVKKANFVLYFYPKNPKPPVVPGPAPVPPLPGAPVAPPPQP